MSDIEAIKPSEPPAHELDEAKPDTKPEPKAVIDDELTKQAEHDANIQRLVDSKKYELPITTEEKRKSKRFVVLGIILAVVLTLAWIDVALDASIIKLPGIKPVTHIFSS